MGVLGWIGRIVCALLLAVAAAGLLLVGAALFNAGNWLAWLFVAGGAGVAFVSLAPLAHVRRGRVEVGEYDDEDGDPHAGWLWRRGN